MKTLRNIKYATKDEYKVLKEAILISMWSDPIKFAQDNFWFVSPDKTLKLSPTQEQFLRDFAEPKPFKAVLSGSRGSGKSLMAAIVGLWAVVMLPYIIGVDEYNVLIMGGTQRQADQVYSYIKKAIEKNDLLRTMAKSSIKSKTIFLHGEIKVYPSSQAAARHAHVDGLILEEAAMIDEDIFKAVLSTIDESKLLRLVMTSTPGEDPSHIFNQILMKPDAYGIEKVYTISYKEAFWKSKEEIELKKQLLTPEEFEREYEGKVVLSTGENSFDYRKWSKYGMEKITYSAKQPTFMSIDWGFSEASPGAVIIAQERVGTIYIIDAFYFYGDPDYHLERIESLANRYNVKYIYTDASHRSENDRLIKKGLPVIPIQASHNKLNMILRLKNYLESGKIRFPITNKNLIKEFSRYKWTVDGDRFISGYKMDHMVDALALLLWGLKQRVEMDDGVSPFIWIGSY